MSRYGIYLINPSLYRGSSSNTVFWAPREGVLEENSVGGGIFKYYLLVRRAPLYFQSTFVHLFLNEGTSVINEIKTFGLSFACQEKRHPSVFIKDSKLSAIFCLCIYMEKKRKLPKLYLKALIYSLCLQPMVVLNYDTEKTVLIRKLALIWVEKKQC